MMSHPAILGSTGKREALRQDMMKLFDHQRRDAWLTEKVSDNILVGQGVTLADVQRWLREVLQKDVALSSNG